MSVLAPPPLFTRDNTNLLAPLGDGWEWTTKVSCRPWRVLIFNLRLSDFCATPDCIADLAFTDQFGNPIPNAGDLGALLGLLVTLPGEVKAKPGRNSPDLPATFKEHDEAKPMQKVQLVLEPLRSPFEEHVLVGLRLHVLLFDHQGDFPTLTSNIWRRVLEANDLRRKKAARCQKRPAPTNEDPAYASRNVASVASLGKMWRGVLQNDVTGAQRTLERWVAKHRGGSVANVGLSEATVMRYMQLSVHRLSPEWLLRFGPEALALRAPMETGAEQLNVESYYTAEGDAYRFPVGEVLVYAGDIQAMHAKFPTNLSNELMRSIEEYGCGGQSYHGTSRIADGGSVRLNRKRNRDLDVDSDEGEESESE